MFTLKELIREYAFIALAAFLLSALITPLIRRLCQQRNIFDLPSEPRKIHTKPIPRLGGIAIYSAFFLPLFTILLTAGQAFALFSQNINILINLLLTGSLVFAIGVYDDIKGATVFQKLTVQTAAAVLIYLLDFKITLLSVPFWGGVSVGIFGLPLTILWIVGITNALNFIDGIDGLACGVGFFSVSTMFFLSLYLNHPLTAFFAAALAGAILGFSVYNFAPASIFMGDSGSLFIGFMIAAISLHGSQKSSTAVVLLIPIVALGVPITDTLLAIIRRLGQGISPFKADKEHIHHKLLNLGFSSRQVTLVLYGVSILLGITALLMTAGNNQILAMLLLMLGIIAVVGMRMLGYTTDMIHINALAKERIQQKRRMLQRQKYAEVILTNIENAVDLPALQKELIRYFEGMEFDVGHFRLSNDPTKDVIWCSMRYEEHRISHGHLWTISFPLLSSDAIKHGELSISQYINPGSSSFESMLLIEKLSLAIHLALSRILNSA